MQTIVFLHNLINNDSVGVGHRAPNEVLHTSAGYCWCAPVCVHVYIYIYVCNSYIVYVLHMLYHYPLILYLPPICLKNWSPIEKFHTSIISDCEKLLSNPVLWCSDSTKLCLIKWIRAMIIISSELNFWLWYGRLNQSSLFSVNCHYIFFHTWNVLCRLFSGLKGETVSLSICRKSASHL